MADPDEPSHLSRISTRWDELLRAHQGDGDAATLAQQAILRRYCGAIYRYLLGIVRSPDVAEELAQEFALRFMRGGFKGVSPERGRFRDFVKKSLANLVVDYHRRLRNRPVSLLEGGDDLAAPGEEVEAADEAFVHHWRAELLGRTWETLAGEEAAGGRPFHTVLRWRVEHPDEPAARLAEQLSQRTGKPVSEGNVRVTLHRARERFADLLIDEVARSLQSADRGRIEQELVDLDLLVYCRPALDRRDAR